MAVDDLYRLTYKGEDLVEKGVPVRGTSDEDFFSAHMDLAVLVVLESGAQEYEQILDQVGGFWRGQRTATERDVRDVLRRLFEAGYIEKVD